jgi:hypothetical protein
MFAAKLSECRVDLSTIASVTDLVDVRLYARSR